MARIRNWLEEQRIRRLLAFEGEKQSATRRAQMEEQVQRLASTMLRDLEENVIAKHERKRAEEMERMRVRDKRRRERRRRRRERGARGGVDAPLSDDSDATWGVS